MSQRDAIAPVTLEGRHVRVEPLDLERHFDGLCEIASDPELWRWMLSDGSTRDGLRTYLEAAVRDFGEGGSLPFATVDRATGRPVGSTRFGNHSRRDRRVEIGWTWIGKPWQRTAINTEAKLLMFGHAFETLGCVRVELKTHVGNARSRAAILRLGAREEGIFRKHGVSDAGVPRDTAYYSVIDDEWPAVKARLEQALERHEATK